MTRRAWVLTVAAGLGSSCLSACVHTQDRSAPTVLQRPGPVARSDAAGGAVAETASPYQPFPSPLVAEVKPPPAAERAATAKTAPEPSGPSLPVILPPPAEVKTEITPAGASDLVMRTKAPEDPVLVASLRCFLDKHPEDAKEYLKDFDPVNQNLLLCLLPLAARLAEGKLNQLAPDDVDALVQELDGLAVPLRARAPLIITRACFCESIKTFGVYSPFPDSHRFRHGDRVQIYVELRNFTSKEQKLSSGEVRQKVDLVSSAEIRDFSNKVVSRIDFQRDGPDESRTLRHDYFDTYGFWVPDNIPPGSYTLWITVEDRGTVPPRTVKQSLDFRVGLSDQGS
jgi:hypothetical protein